MIEVNLQQKLGSLLFNTVYYLNEVEMAGAQTTFNLILTARSFIQTGDVEYLSATATRSGIVNPEQQSLTLSVTRGQAGGSTAPVANFLTFKLYCATGRYTTQRLRGYPVNELTENSVFNFLGSGDADIDNVADGSIQPEPTVVGYGNFLDEYLANCAGNTRSRDGRTISSYARSASTGSKAIRRTI